MTTASKPKVTKEIIEGKEKIPAGYTLKTIKHKGFEYKNKLGNTVKVAAHDEHVLVPVKKEEVKKEEPKKSEVKVEEKSEVKVEEKKGNGNGKKLIGVKDVPAQKKANGKK